MTGEKETGPTKLPLQSPIEGVIFHGLATSEPDAEKEDLIFKLHLSAGDRNFLISNNLYTIQDIIETIVSQEQGVSKTRGLTPQRILNLKAALEEYNRRSQSAELKWALAQKTY